jgi:hypothetical protein
MKHQDGQLAKVIPITVAPRGLHGASAKLGEKEEFVEDKPFGSSIGKIGKKSEKQKSLWRRIFSRDS